MMKVGPLLGVALLVAAGACGSSGETVADATAGTPDARPDAGSPDAAPRPAATRWDGQTAVKTLPAGGGWMVLLETLQPQLVITVPARRVVLLGADLATRRTLAPIEGWTLLDAVAHPSGDVSAVYVRVDYADPDPLHVQLSRHRIDGTRVDTEIAQVKAPEDLGLRFMASLDRARLVAAGDDVTLAARWSGNAVHASRFRFGGQGFEEAWTVRVEPEAEVGILGIIGGGFDNFHQGDNKVFVYLDVDDAGNSYVAVPSGESVLARHDETFGEHLSDGADPARFEFGAAILTRIDAQGGRVYARLLGTPGQRKSLLGMRVGRGAVLLVGRVKISSDPGGWDAWIASASAATGELGFERALDVDQGDMFWDAVPVAGGQTIAVGSTRYTQNPSGLSVSDDRDALGVVLDAEGRVVKRLELPRGSEPRGNEAISVRATEGGDLVISGMLDGPGTHAEVRSNGFLDLRELLTTITHM